MASSTAGSAPRYAPHDPSLPPPWTALVDGSTGYIYYWNTETNSTQYEKPPPFVPPLPVGPPPAAGAQSTNPQTAPFSNITAATTDSQNSGLVSRQSDTTCENMHPSTSRSTFTDSGRGVSHQTGGANAHESNSLPAQGAMHGNYGGSSHGASYTAVHGGIDVPMHGMAHESAGSLHGLKHGSAGVQSFAGPGEDLHRTSGGNAYGSNAGSVQGTVHGVPTPSHARTHGMVLGSAGTPSVGVVPGNPGLPTHGLVHGSSGGSFLGRGRMHMMGASSHRGLQSDPIRPSREAINGTSGVLHGGLRHGGTNSSLGGKWHGNISGSMHANLGPVISVPGQPPKLAVIPRGRDQQNVEEMHTRFQSTVGHGHIHITPAATTTITTASTVTSVTGSAMGFNHGASYSYNYQDGSKRSSVQILVDTPPVNDVNSYRRVHEVSTLGENVPDPFMTFEATGFPAEILRELQAAGFSSPMPIQAQSWPIALQNRDIVAVAKTGSGKTLGYLLPAFLHLGRYCNNSQLGPTVLVLSPTRELATQIQQEAIKFGRSSRISSTCIYGGVPKGSQLRDLERGADIVIATPGRLNDFLEMRKVSLRQVTYLVLDEADRMLDMGFEPQIRKILNEIPPRRQTLMYTATWPKEVRKIAGDLLINPIHVNIGSVDELNANTSIIQHVEMISPYEKHRRLEQILRSQGPGSKILIFCSTKRMCNQLGKTLNHDFRAAVIHGDKSQSERDYVLAQFKSGRSPVLIATDVAARGLDVKDIRVVINFDFPTCVENYVHRIGRTGRAGATGVSYTFFSEQDAKYAKELIKVLEGAGQKVPLELREIAGRPSFSKGHWDAGGRGRREGGHSSYGVGRDYNFNGRGALGGLRSQHADRQDRKLNRSGDHDWFDRNDQHKRYGDDKYRGRDFHKGFSARSRSYSRSYSRSPSRSRSRSFDRIGDGHDYSSPYHGGNSQCSRSPDYTYHRNSPYYSPREILPYGALPYHRGSRHRSRSPYTVPSPCHGGSPYRNSPMSGNPKYSGALLQSMPPSKGTLPSRAASSSPQETPPPSLHSHDKIDISQQEGFPSTQSLPFQSASLVHSAS